MSLEAQEKEPGAGAVLVEAAFETLTDEMIGRLAKTASDGLTLLDEMQAHRVAEALPVIKELVASGDLVRLSHLVRLVGAAEDALTDDLVGRLAGLASHGMTVLDRLGRPDSERYWEMAARLSDGLTPAVLDRLFKQLPALLGLLEGLQESGVLEDVVGAVERTRKDLSSLPRPGGGLSGLWALMKDAENQRTLQALLLFGRQVLSGNAKA